MKHLFFFLVAVVPDNVTVGRGDVFIESKQNRTPKRFATTSGKGETDTIEKQTVDKCLDD